MKAYASQVLVHTECMHCPLCWLLYWTGDGLGKQGACLSPGRGALLLEK